MSAWIEPRRTKAGEPRYVVKFRPGGRVSAKHYGGSFRRRAHAQARARLIDGQLALGQWPSWQIAEQTRSPSFAEAAAAWQQARRDVREATAVQHGVALKRALPIIGATPIDELTIADLDRLVSELDAAGKARGSIRKTKTAVAMVLDHFEIDPNPARDPRVRLPREEQVEPEPPEAACIEAAAALLRPEYRIALYVLDASGCRLGELTKATVGDLDEQRQGFRVRSAVSKTKRPRLIGLPDDLWQALLDRLPPREDRHGEMSLLPDVTADRLRTAIARACKAAGVPVFSPHDLRHRRISLWHRQGLSFAEVGQKVGQRSLSVTADTYTHVLLDDYREIARIL